MLICKIFFYLYILSLVKRDMPLVYWDVQRVWLFFLASYFAPLYLYYVISRPRLEEPNFSVVVLDSSIE
jgi:hypothetical protein